MLSLSVCGHRVEVLENAVWSKDVRAHFVIEQLQCIEHETLDI